MRPIRIAAQLHPQHGDYPGLRTAVVRAEDLGYDIAYTWDHFFPLYGGPRRRPSRVLDAARRLGRGDRSDRARSARDLRPVPQPRPHRRHGPDDRSDRRGPVHPRRRIGLVPPGLRGIRLPVRHRRFPSADAGGGAAADRQPARAAGPAAGASAAAADRGHGSAADPPARRRARRQLARRVPRPPGRARAGGRRPACLVRDRRAGIRSTSNGGSASSPTTSTGSWPRTRRRTSRWASASSRSGSTVRAGRSAAVPPGWPGGMR